MNIIACIAHETTGNTVNSLVRGNKYSCWRIIRSSHIGQNTVLFCNSSTPQNCNCVFWHKSSKSNRWSFFNSNIWCIYTIIFNTKSPPSGSILININLVKDLCYISFWIFQDSLVEFNTLKSISFKIEVEASNMTWCLQFTHYSCEFFYYTLT